MKKQISRLLAATMLITSTTNSSVIFAAESKQVAQNEVLPQISVHILGHAQKTEYILYQYTGEGNVNDITNYTSLKKIQQSNDNYNIRVSYDDQSKGKYAIVSQENDEVFFFHIDEASIQKSLNSKKEIPVYVHIGQDNLKNKRLKSVDIDPETIDVQNVHVKIDNTDMQRQPLNGSFGIYAKEDIIDKEEHIVAKKDAVLYVFNADDEKEINMQLPVGKYYAKQLSASDGYVKTTKEKSFEVEKMLDATIPEVILAFENQMTKISISVKDQDDKPVRGGIYTIMDSDNKVVQTFSFSDNSPIEILRLKDGETYEIMQNKSIDGYQNIKPTKITVKGSEEGETQDIELAAPYIVAKIKTKTKIDGLISGVRNVKLHLEKYGDQWTSTASSVKELKKIPAGKYKVVIDEVPEGFINPEPKEIEITDQSQEQSFDVYIEPRKTTISIKDSEGNKITDVKGILTNEMSLPLTLLDYTKDSGNRKIDGVTNYQEADLSAIFALPESEKYFYQIKNIEEGCVSDNGRHEVIAGKDNEITVNLIKANLVIQNKENVIPAEGTITDEEGNVYYKGDLNHEFKKIPAGKYHVEIKKIADGYVRDSFDIDIQDQKEKNLLIHEVDAVNTSIQVFSENEIVKNAVVQLKDEKGVVVKEWTSNGQPYEIHNIAPGEYVLHVKNIPNQYITPEDQEMNIKETSQKQEFKIDVQKPKVQIQADSDGETLKGVQFEIKGRNEVYKTPSSVQNLEKGAYTLHVTDVPEGYVKPKDQKIVVEDKSDVQEFMIPVDYTKISFDVVSKEYNKALKGVKVQLKNTGYEFTSTFNAKEYAKIPVGTYQITVTDVPKGFRIPKEQTIIVKETSNPQNFRIEVGLTHKTEGSEIISQLGQDIKNGKNQSSGDNLSNDVISKGKSETGQSSILTAGIGIVFSIAGIFGIKRRRER